MFANCWQVFIVESKLFRICSFSIKSQYGSPIFLALAAIPPTLSVYERCKISTKLIVWYFYFIY